MIRYEFREPLTIKNAKNADPGKIGAELTAIATEAGGELTPDTVVARARDKKSALHQHFEWDDALAAGAHRRDQARQIIRCVRIVNDDEDPRPAFLSVAGDDGHSYRTIASVMASSDFQRRVLEQADRDLAAWERRYAEITDACKLVHGARKKIKRRIEAADERPGA